LEAPVVADHRPSPRGDATRAAILDAAEELFAERGFAGTSMRALAEAADTSQPLLHHHFGTKRGLYSAVKDRFTERYEGFRPPDPGGTMGLAYVEQALLGYLRFLESNPRMSRLMAWSRLEGDEQPWGQADEVWRRMQGVVGSARDAGLLKASLDPGLFIVQAAGIVQYWVDNRAAVCRALGMDADADGLDERYVAQCVEVLLAGGGTPTLLDALS
jgi:TetR/AcrR family transcriptional regulator